MISRTSRYALQILGYLASHREGRIRSEEIARGTGIPANYLSKILVQLGKQSIVQAEKGRGGGFRLVPSALERPIGDVVSIFDGIEVDPAPCLFGLPACDADNPCPLHGHWERIREIRDDMTASVRIRDLAGGGIPSGVDPTL